MINKKEVVKILKEECFDKALNDIKLALDVNTNLAVFILGACFIDMMAGFRFGVTKEDIKNKKSHNTRNFIQFIKEYLPQYIANDMYSSLRCGLVHNYIDFGKYAFRNKKVEGIKHRDIYSDKIIIIDENLYKELQIACDKFIKDIFEKDEIFLNVIKRYNSMGVMRVVWI